MKRATPRYYHAGDGRVFCRPVTKSGGTSFGFHLLTIAEYVVDRDVAAVYIAELLSKNARKEDADLERNR
jgi:hypothetical protein